MFASTLSDMPGSDSKLPVAARNPLGGASTTFYNLVVPGIAASA